MGLNKLNIIWRNVTTQKNIILSPNPIQKYILVRKSTNNKSSSSSSSSSDSDNDETPSKKPDPKPESREAVNTKLNSLLHLLVQNDEVAKKSELKLARPPNKRVPKEERETKKTETVDKKIIKAATDVAQEFGGDTKKTESELLSKLLGPADVQKNLNEIVKGMRIDREPKPVERTKAEQVRSLLQNMQRKQIREPSRQTKTRSTEYYKPRREIVVKKIDLFGAEPLGIFTNKDLKEKYLETWQKLYEKDLKNAITHPPANYFQEMILWTEQGKLWKFPIDNEQGLDEEKEVDFTKHIFLEEHLEPWCPPRGPIRHFMELVCVGLSKNHHLTVEAKIEHIKWFKNYFDDKKKLLQEVGALATGSEDSKTQKQIE